MSYVKILQDTGTKLACGKHKIDLVGIVILENFSLPHLYLYNGGSNSTLLWVIFRIK